MHATRDYHIKSKERQKRERQTPYDIPFIRGNVK